MVKRIINRHRPLQSGELAARYRRLRYAEGAEARRVEADEPDVREPTHLDGTDETESSDFLWQEIRARIMAAGPFNPVVSEAVPGPPPSHDAFPVGADSRSPTDLEARLAAFHEHLHDPGSVVSDTASGIEADLHFLGRIAHDRLNGSLDAVAAIALLSPFWLRSPRSWPAPDGGHDGVVASLVEHVFLGCAVPRFLLNAWAERRYLDTRWLLWTVVLGQGGSLRQLNRRIRQGPRGAGWGSIAADLPSHLFEVPERSAPTDGVMLAEVLRLGGQPLQFRQLLLAPGYRLDPTAYDSEHAERVFWTNTVHWLVRHRELLADDFDCRVILMWAKHRQSEHGPRFRWRDYSHQSAERAARAHRIYGTQDRGLR